MEGLLPFPTAAVLLADHGARVVEAVRGGECLTSKRSTRGCVASQGTRLSLKCSEVGRLLVGLLMLGPGPLRGQQQAGTRTE